MRSSSRSSALRNSESWWMLIVNVKVNNLDLCASYMTVLVLCQEIHPMMYVLGFWLTVYIRNILTAPLFSWIWMMETVSMLWSSKLEVVKYTSDTITPHKHTHTFDFFLSLTNSRIRLLGISLSIKHLVFIQSCKRDKLLHLVISATSVHLPFYSNKYIFLTYQWWC